MMRSRILPALFAVTALLLGVAPLRADVTLPAILGDHMVLLSGHPVPIWGWAEPGEKITVTFAGQTQKAQADAHGAWHVTLRPLVAGGPAEMTITGKNKLTLSDVLVGEVWLASGQSNMRFRLRESTGGAKAASRATDDQLRLFTVPVNAAAQPEQRGRGKWVVCNPKDAAPFSAVAYYFGHELRQQLHVPMGLIASDVGGTPAEAWTSIAALEKQPALKPRVTAAQKKIAHYNANAAETAYGQALAQWQAAAAEAKAANKRLPRKPRKPRDPATDADTPGTLFNGMIHPLIPFAIRGTIWYQGERNANYHRAYDYRIALPTLIQDWRTRWGNRELPFGIVQLPNWHAPQTQPVQPNAWSVLRESQLLTAQRLPNVGLIVTIDLGDAKTIHPPDKADVGHRLALWALASVYGKNVVYSGPMLDAMKIQGNQVRLHFRHVDGGLVAKDGGKLTGFALAGADKVFHAAQATIAGEEVILQAAGVQKPVAARYAWAFNPVCNLYNKAGLPASPFRTDTWPVVSQPK